MWRSGHLFRVIFLARRCACTEVHVHATARFGAPTRVYEKHVQAIATKLQGQVVCLSRLCVFTEVCAQVTSRFSAPVRVSESTCSSDSGKSY